MENLCINDGALQGKWYLGGIKINRKKIVRRTNIYLQKKMYIFSSLEEIIVSGFAKISDISGRILKYKKNVQK